MLAFKNAMLFDGARLEENISILTDSGSIVSVGKNISIPGDCTAVDLKGGFVMPGLIDAHTHFGGTSLMKRPGAVFRRRDAAFDYAEARERLFQYGITTVRTCGDICPDILEFRDDVNAGKVVSPRVIVCGPMFQAAGGHPWGTVMREDPEVRDAFILIDGDTDIEKEVNLVADSGVGCPLCATATIRMR